MSYSEDLAYIHNAGFTELARSAAATLLNLLRKRKVTTGLVVDLGCGSGVLAKALTRAGYEVLGIDISESMLKLARKRAPKARFVRASLFRAKLPNCAAVTAIGECLNYIFEPRKSQDLVRLFRGIHEAFQPGGVLLFDIATLDQREVRLCTQGDDWAALIDKRVDKRKHLLLRKITIFRAVGRLYRRSSETHVQKLYASSEIAAALETAGFRVTRLAGYEGERFAGGRVAFLATKPLI